MSIPSVSGTSQPSEKKPPIEKAENQNGSQVAQRHFASRQSHQTSRLQSVGNSHSVEQVSHSYHFFSRIASQRAQSVANRTIPSHFPADNQYAQTSQFQPYFQHYPQWTNHQLPTYPLCQDGYSIDLLLSLKD